MWSWWRPPQNQNSCHNLSDEEAEYYLRRYSDALASCGGHYDNLNCARNHWKNTGCKEKRDYKLPDSCNYVLTDEEALCYIQNNLNFKTVGNDLNQARNHWKRYGCIRNLSYMCPTDSRVQDLSNQLLVTTNEMTDLGADYKAYADKTQEKLDNILKLEVTSLPFVFHAVHKQNEHLEKQVVQTSNDKLTKNQSAFYQEAKNEHQDFINTVLFWIYYIVVFLFVGILFLVKTEVDFKLKVGLIVIFCLYPFFIYPVEYSVWWLVSYIRKFI